MAQNTELSAEMRRQIAVERIRGFENIDSKYTLVLEGEIDENNESVEGDVFWVKLNNKSADGENHTIEGKLFLPKSDKSNKELVICEPGMPGDGVILFDSRHAPALVKEGYAVFVARHNGTKLQGDKADNYVHCPQKKEFSSQSDQDHVGKEFSFQEWGKEAHTAIMGLEAGFEKISLVGHSMGAPNNLNALLILAKENPEVADKIKSFVSLAGAVGRPRSDGSFDPENVLNADRLKGFLSYIKDAGIHHSIDPAANLEQFKKHTGGLYEGDFSPYKDVSFSFRSPSRFFGRGNPDEYCPLSASQEFGTYLEKQVKKVNVEAFVTEQPEGKEAHDFSKLKSDVLLRMLKGEKYRHIFKKGYQN